MFLSLKCHESNFKYVHRKTNNSEQKYRSRDFISMYMLWKSSLSLISTCIKQVYNDYGSEVDEYKTFLPKSER